MLKKFFVLRIITIQLFLLFCASVFLIKFYPIESLMNFYSTYLIELTLSIDNIIVFLLIIDHFRIPDTLVSKMLNYGLIGAIFTRAIVIFFFFSTLEKLHWTSIIMACFLFYWI